MKKGKSKIVLSSILMSFLVMTCDSFVTQIAEKDDEVLTFAHMGETETNQLFYEFVDDVATPIYLDNNYSSYYFKNLNANFGNNKYGTCSYVSIGMLLSFYDSYWDDSFIPENYDVKTEFQSNRQLYADFDLIPSSVNSPGVLFEPNSLVDNLTIQEYYNLIDNYSQDYFQFGLIDIAMSIFGDAKFDGSDSSLGMSQSDIAYFLTTYIYQHTNISSNDILVNSYSNPNDELIREYVIKNVTAGTPVILRAKEKTSNFGHSMIAYDYNEKTNEIYVHTGWRDETNNIALTHVSLNDLPFDDLLDCTSLTIKSNYKHTHSYQYHSSSGSNICACSYIYPRELKLVDGNYADSLPTYEWMSLYKEKWFENTLRFKLSILDSNRYAKTSISRLGSKEYTLSQEEWDVARFGTFGKTYNILLTIDEYSQLPYSDEYWCRTSFNKPLTYESLPYIKPAEYGFAEAYPSDTVTSTTFINHTAHNNGSFQTKRFRTGYIHGEYIVMSPIRSGFSHAFIEYRFNAPVSRIDVQLSHWREYSSEQLSSANGKAEVQAYINGNWVCQLDMLSSSTNLPTDRTNPNTYKIVFDEPVYNFRFYAETFTTPTNNSNKGRICIGDLAYYEYGGLPLSGYELDYQPNLWQGEPMQNNCYAYALNNQVHPGTNQIWYKQQPGEYSNSTQYPFTKQVLKPAVTNDFNLYNKNFGTNLIFKEVSKYSVVPQGTYKVALVAYSGDYHWYRQDSDGYWSHKPGTTPVKRTDNSGNLILDPENCDRGYYTDFLGFYALKPWNNLY